MGKERNVPWEEILRRRKEGETARALAEEFGVSVESVYKRGQRERLEQRGSLQQAARNLCRSAGSMVAQMDDLINTYTDSSNGIITLRQQNIDDQMSKIQDEGDQLTDTYNANYDRYLEEYTNTLVEVYTMKASMAAFA